VQFLISGNTLMQLCLERSTAASAWAEHKPVADLRLSLIGVSMARAWVNALEPAPRMTWSRSLEHRINEIMRESMRPLPLDERVMSAWADIRAAKLEQAVTDEHGATALEGIGQDQRLEIATAIAYGLILVDPWATFHDQLRGMGLDRFVESLH
jgi:hypothetical protein